MVQPGMHPGGPPEPVTLGHMPVVGETQQLEADVTIEPRRSDAEAQVVEFLESGQIDGIIRLLHRDFHDYASFEEVAEAAYDGVAAFWERSLVAEIGTPGGYVYRVARNILLKLADPRRRSAPLNEREVEEAAEPRRDLSAALAYIESLVEAWPTDHVKVITGIVVRAAARGDVVSARDMVEVARAGGYSMSEAAARTWKSRGLARLDLRAAATAASSSCGG